VKKIVTLGLTFSIICALALIFKPAGDTSNLKYASVNLATNKMDSETMSNYIDSTLDAMMDNISAENPEIMAMSSPYAYIDNSYFKNIVALGTDALPVIESKIKERNGDLYASILTIAAEKIENTPKQL